MTLAVQAVLLLVSLAGVASISFTLPADATKCLQEDVEKDVLVVGEYKISDHPNVEISLEVSNLRKK